MKELDLNKKKRILVMMIVIGLLLIVIIGAAVAFMAPNINNTETSSTIVFNSGTVAIEYKNGENQINAKDILPGWTAIKEFSVTAKNNTDIDASDVMNYALKLVVEENTFSSGAITYELEGENVGNNGTLAYILPNTLNTVKKGATKTISLGYGTFEQTNDLKEGVTHKYTLTLAFPNKTYESQSKDMGKQLSAYITIEKPTEDFAKLTITDEGHDINNLTINVEKNVAFDLSNPEYANNQLFSRWKVDTGTASIGIGNNMITVTSDEASVISTYSTTTEINYTDDHSWTISFFAPYTGIYKLEAWGASGGTSTATGGYGAYATGNIRLKKGEIIYLYVGEQGTKPSKSTADETLGGYNGGGSAYYAGGTGGGATHFSFEDSLLKDTTDKSRVILVAAGGGGGGNYSVNNKGGSGGGIVGVDGGYLSNSYIQNGTGGTQTSGGKINHSASVDGTNGDFGYGGKGGYNSGYKHGSGAGGGGYYGGGGGSSRNGGGGGGSSFIGSNRLLDDGNKVMYCYNCKESSENSTKTISTSNYSSEATANYAKEGNGYARITIQAIEEDAEYSTITVVNEELHEVTTIETKKGNKISIPINSNSEYIFDKYEIEKGTAEIDGLYITPTSDILVIKVVNLPEKKSSEFAYIEPTINNTEPYYEYKAPASGTYKLETWGAQGGYGYDETKYPGGYGGYSTGYIQLNKGEKIYIYVGGKGTSGKEKIVEIIPGGYNGGGNGRGADNKYNSGGGGATHVAKDLGLLTTFENKRDDLLIVAAGGGGSGYQGTSNYGYGGHGGGYHGVKSTNKGETATATGATQTGSGTGKYPGIFGLGGCYNATSESCSGGGGGLYGGDANRYYNGGTGGSSYIGNNSLTDKVMYCYDCSESTAENTYTINTNGTNSLLDKEKCPNGYSTDAISKCAKAGDGYARITYIS